MSELKADRHTNVRLQDFMLQRSVSEQLHNPPRKVSPNTLAQLAAANFLPESFPNNLVSSATTDSPSWLKFSVLRTCGVGTRRYIDSTTYGNECNRNPLQKLSVGLVKLAFKKSYLRRQQNDSQRQEDQRQPHQRKKISWPDRHQLESGLMPQSTDYSQRASRNSTTPRATRRF